MLAVVLYYCTFQHNCTVRFKTFSLFFLCTYLCDKYYKLVMGQYYIGAYVSLVPRLILLNLEQIGLTNMLLEQNSFTCKGLTV